jgi:hypothetical protein
MMPKARDPRMDRATSDPDQQPSVLLWPARATSDVEHVGIEHVSAGQAAGSMKRMVALLAVLLVIIMASTPRTVAYGSLVGENLELRQRLQDVERRMAQADRMMLRLRLYDAQLRSLSTANGDHGP